ncbi:MAG: hypothetical protein M1370_05165 [Bacteroidetes bacterium]|nr:hypothetical protein [Bacteroidota bacterium]
MIRVLRPTDFGAFLALRRTLLPNQALTKTNPEPLSPTLFSFVRDAMLVPPLRHSWIEVRDGFPQGLVSAKARPGTDMWDVDQLIVPDSPENGGDGGLALLAKVCETALQEGIHRVFLRVAAESPVMAAARRAGFCHYTTEYVYRLSATPRDGEWLPPGLRPRRRADHQALFHLYSTCVPAGVRSVEGMTLQEWRWNDGWGIRQAGWIGKRLRNRQDFVLDEDGELTAWLRISRRHRTLELLCLPEWQGQLQDMVRFGVLVLGDWQPITCPVRAYQTALCLPLEKLGFKLLGEHALLARSLLARVTQPKLMPVGI